MRDKSARACLTLAIAVIAVFAISATASAATTAPACKAHASNKKVCFPKEISGTFSGENNCYSWTGTLSMKRHRQQTSYAYIGDGKFDWIYKPACNEGCTTSITMGTVAIKPGLTINRNRNPGQGWIYSGGDGGEKLLGEISLDCGDGPRPPEKETLLAAFAPGGQSKKLRSFKGTQELGTVYKWSLKGSN